MKRLFALLMALLMVLAAGFSIAEEKGEIVIPEVNIRKQEMPENEALQMIRDMKAGWNLGNTFDAYDCSWLSNEMDYESAWCGQKTTEALVDALQEAGFNTLRVPVSWHNHLDADWKISEAWLNRVHEVVSWAYDRGMYVILNIHHDNAKAYYYPDSAHYENSAAYIRTIWTQLAERFCDFDSHLIFEAINEPRLVGTDHEWWWDPNDAACQDAMAQIMALNQVFVDTVRQTGGKNADRYLMVPAYDASPDYACSDAFSLPQDTADNRIILSVHAYTPYEFALQDPGVSEFSLEDNNQKYSITYFLQRLHEKYVSQGIPVLVGEFGAMEKKSNLQDRVDWISWYVANARARGMSCCWWDNNLFQGNDERFGLFDRKTAECVNPEILEAFMKYCEE